MLDYTEEGDFEEYRINGVAHVEDELVEFEFGPHYNREKLLELAESLGTVEYSISTVSSRETIATDEWKEMLEDAYENAEYVWDSESGQEQQD